MRALALGMVLLWAVPTFAKPRQWQDATVAAINSQANDNGAAVVPIGGALYRVKIRSTTLWYTIETQDTTYVLAQVIQGRKHPLNVTLHGKTKISIDGSNAHILDDAGKDVKLPIVRKIAQARVVAGPTLSPSSLPQTQPKFDGYWWASMTPSFQLGWAVGYVKAMDLAGSIQMSTCAFNLPLYQKEWPNLAPKDILQKMCLSDNQFDYDGISMGQFVDGIDAFYTDYRNKQLEVGWAIQYARDSTKGKPAQELAAEVALWRRCTVADKSHRMPRSSEDAALISKACTPDNPTAPPPK